MDSSTSKEVHGDPGITMYHRAYMSAIKNLPFNHQLCIDLLTNGNAYDDNMKQFCLEIILKHVEHTYIYVDKYARERMREFLLKYILLQGHQKRFDTIKVRHISARIYFMVFVTDYLKHCNSLFNIIVDMVEMDNKIVDHTLRVLHMITHWLENETAPPCKLADRKVKILIRKQMEENDVRKIVKFLHKILVGYKMWTSETLEILCSLIEWTNINHFIYSPIIDMIYLVLNSSSPSCEIAKCFMIKLLKSPQPPLEKLILVEMLSPLATRVCRVGGEILNAAGTTLISNLRQSQSEGETQSLLTAIELRFDEMLEHLQSDDDETSTSVLEFALMYANMVGERVEMTEAETHRLTRLLETAVTKSRMKDNLRQEEVDLFRVHRRSIGNLIKTISGFDKNLVLGSVRGKVSTLIDWAYQPWKDCELAMYLIELMCERFPYLVSNTDNGDYRDELCEMVETVLKSGIENHHYPSVAQQFLATAVSWPAYLASRPHFIKTILAVFLHRLPRGDCNRPFHKFVVSLSDQLAGHAANILDTCMTCFGNREYIGENQLDLYEATSLVIVTGNIPLFQRKVFHLELIYPTLNDFRKAVSAWPEASSSSRDILSEIMCFSIDALTRTTFAFTDLESLRKHDCVDNYLKAFEVVKYSFALAKTRPDIHRSMVKLISRLIDILEDTFIPYIESVVTDLCSTTDKDSISAAVQIQVKIIDCYKTKVLGFIKEELQMIGKATFNAFSGDDLDFEEATKDLERLEMNSLLYLRALIRNEMFEAVFLTTDQKYVLNMLEVLTTGNLLSVTVSDEKIEEYKGYLDDDMIDEERVVIVVQELRSYFEETKVSDQLFCTSNQFRAK